MKAEIIAVGTELLLGQIVNTNAQFLSKELAAIGVDVYFQTVVGDNASRMRQAIETARSRADIVVFSGGIGPTQDDITKDVLADLLGLNLLMDQRSLDQIEKMFTRRGTVMTENNKRQATIIEGASPLLNETGLALGNAISHEGTHYIILPGPPKELKPMFTNQVLPWLYQHVLAGEMPIYSKMLKFAGIGESMLEDKLKDLITSQTDPTIAPYASEGEVTVRISTKAPSEREAMVKLNELELLIQQRLPEHMYASHDIPIEHVIVEMMADREQTLAAAESCTGGLLMALLTSIPGSGTMLRGGFVCYSNEMKEKLLNVPHHYLEGEDAPGAVSPEVAKVLAEQAQMIADSDYGLSITGVAGPGYSERKEVGLVYIGIAERDKETEVHELKLSGNRETIRIRSAKTILYRLWRRLVENEKLN